MRKKWMFLSFIMLLMVTGCQSNRGADEKNAAYDLRKDRTSPNFMSNRNNGGERDVAENDIADQNPNFLNLNRSGDRGEFDGENQGSDVDKAKKVVAATDEFTIDSVWMNGDRMWVSVYKKGMLSDKERIDAEARLHRKLIRALPRYNIDVRVKEDRR